MDQFPVQHGHFLQLDAAAPGLEPPATPPEDEAVEVPKSSRRYFLGPTGLDAREAPLLLNPLNPIPARSPEQHLRYGAAGCVVALNDSALGTNSMRVYNLKRENLRQRRQEAQAIAHRAYYSLRMQLPSPQRDAELTDLLEKYRSGLVDFSTAALDHLRADLQQQDLLLIPPPRGLINQ